MKKLLSLLVCVSILVTMPLYSFAAEELVYGDYHYTTSGVLTKVDDLNYQDYVIVPREINGTSINRLGDSAMANGELINVHFESGIETIGKSAFEESSLVKVTMQHTLKSIEDRAFANCSQLEYLEIDAINDISFGKDCFVGTGFLTFSVPCSIDTTNWYDEIAAAKGDDNFYIERKHSFIEPLDGSPAACLACGETPGGEGIGDAPQFIDVNPDAWYYKDVNVASEFGILSGKGEGRFDPDANMTLAEAAKIAACIFSLEIEDGWKDDFIIGNPWYETFVNYCYTMNIIEEGVSFDWNKNATRAEMAYLFSRADVSAKELNPQVTLEYIPDVTSAMGFSNEILNLYKRGIAVGSDDKYTFYPNSNVKRCEAAAFIARIVKPSMRIEII